MVLIGHIYSLSKWWGVAAMPGLHESIEKRVRTKAEVQGLVALVDKWCIFGFVKACASVREISAFQRAEKGCCTLHVITHIKCG